MRKKEWPWWPVLLLGMVMILAVTLMAQDLPHDDIRPRGIPGGIGSLADRVFTWACVFAKKPSMKNFRENLAGMIVVEPDHFTAAEVEELRSNDRLVIAYLSVGEGESYRSYASSTAFRELIGAENRDWPENFSVTFWDDRWRSMLDEYGHQILEKGFDGFFCDVVDAWEAFPEVPERREQMAGLLVSLAKSFRRRYPHLIMILQNSHELFEHPGVFQHFDGLSQEGLFASWLTPSPPAAWKTMKLRALRDLRRQGKYVGLLEYTRSRGQIEVIKRQAWQEGFVPYFSTKKLDRLYQIP